MTILVIVESRAKAPKIEKMLGKGYTVRPCYGHVQDVQHTLKWIDGHAKAGWDPDTIPYTPAKDALKKKTMTELRKLAATASKIVIASDMDREGEAIGYHLCDLLKVKSKKIPTERIVFDQITPEAIQAAIASPTTLREPFYRAQQARRVIDLLFGYTVSPLLWGIAHKLSAGRCQSPALRWLWERQQEFLSLDKVDPKHEIVVQLVKKIKAGAAKGKGGECITDGTVIQGTYQQAKKRASKAKTTTTSATDSAVAAGVDESVLHKLVTFPMWLVVDTTASQPHQAPPLPLTTSALQQKAYGRWKWSPKRTMSVAQKLYEGGHITYMRTDCKVLSAPFVAQATAYLRERFGAEYLGGGTRGSKTTKGKAKKQAHAQEAHEPVRPVYTKREYLGANQATAEGQKLYRLIYETTLSSLMAPCILNKVVVTFHPHVEPPPTKAHVVKADCIEMHFPGHRVWEVKDQLPWASRRPDVAIGDVYDVHEYQSKVHHAVTKKPYTSGDLLKLLETRGVGRPSTYSSILDTLETRKYVVTGESAWQVVLKDHPLSGVQNKDVRIDMRQSPPAWVEKVLSTDLAKQVKDRYNVTALGTEVIGYLVTHLAEMIDADFTKSLEDDLDAIVQGNKTYPEVVGGFYTVLQQRVKGAKAIKSGPSTGPTFVNGHARRTLQETDEWQVVAMQTKFGPAVALFYKDPKRKKEGIFANIQPAQLDAITYEQAKPILDAKQHADASGTAKQGHHVGTTGEGVDVYAKGGPYGNYLTWTDVAGRTQTTTFPDKNLPPTVVTLAQATEWMAAAQLTLHKVSAQYTVKYNAKKDSVYLSKSQGKGKRGRPTYAPMESYGKDDLAKFKKLTIKECDALMEAAAAAKGSRGRGTSGKGRGRGRGRGASAAGVKKKRSSSKKQKVRASKKKEG